MFMEKGRLKILNDLKILQNLQLKIIFRLFSGNCGQGLAKKSG
jgi:hypothetical protein